MPKGIRYLLKLLFFLLLFSPFLYTWVESFYESKIQAIQILNVHEHLENEKQLPKLLEVMKKLGVERTVLLGSPESAIVGTKEGFGGYETNNRMVLKVAGQDPARFLAFPTLDVADNQKLEKLKRYVQEGAKGLKLYSGHKAFHTKALDDASMLPIYRFCSEQKIPIMFHVNAGYYLEELRRVLKLYPDLKVICPHFCLSSITLERLESLLDSYPNLYTDTSFGFIKFLKQGLIRISENPEKYRHFVLKYQDRILFGTDVVVSSEPFKSTTWLSQAARSYRDMLEKADYTFSELPGQPLKGLHLKAGVLKKIYRKNFEHLMSQ